MPQSNFGFKVKVVSVLVVLVFILMVIFGSFGNISTGNIGVKTRFNKVVSTVNPGLYFKIPFMEDVTSMNVQTQKEQVDAEAASSDLQTVHATVAVNYNVEQTKVSDLFTTIGTDYGTKIIAPAIQEAVKASIAKYTAEELITKRPEVTDSIRTGLLAKLSTIGIDTSGVSIVNFDFSSSFNAAIEAKVTAEQNALAAKNKLEQVQYEAQQTVASAKAEAEAIQLKSQAANNEKYVSLKALEVQEEAITKWNGEGCTSYCGMEASTGLLLNGK